jgi:hypothetical protein
MAATTVTRAPINDTDANFRLWGKAISDQLAAGGWVQTTDTGQINWTTVTKPGAANTVAGYEVWRSNDAGGGLNQIYVKIEYGSSGSANIPGVWLTVGWASDGAGALTGITTTRTQITQGISSSTTYACNLAAGTGWFCFVLFTGLTNNGMLLSVERTKAANNSDQNEVLVLTAVYNAGVKSQVLNYATGVYAQETSPNAQAFINLTNAVASGSGGMCLQFGQKGGLTNPSQNVFGGNNTSIGSSATTFTMALYGATRTFIINSQFPSFRGSPAIDYLYTRYE